MIGRGRPPVRVWILLLALMVIAPVPAQGGADASPDASAPSDDRLAAIATYDFDQGSLTANEVESPPLTAIDPMGLNGFLTDDVCGSRKDVYGFAGQRSPPADQGGLALPLQGLLSGAAYTIDLVFSFDENGPEWERILDVSDRSSDQGLYVDPRGRLQVFPLAGGPDLWTFGEYHRATVANDGAGTVSGWLDGVIQFEHATTAMDFDAYDNPEWIATFFADNVEEFAGTEWVAGKVSLIRCMTVH